MVEMLGRRKRFQLSLPVWVRLWQQLAASPRKKTQLTEETITENISSEGCYFYLSKKPALGSKAVMEITVPGKTVGLKDSKVRASGKVVRVDEKRAEGKVGVACTIERFSFRSSDPRQAVAKRPLPS